MKTRLLLFMALSLIITFASCDPESPVNPDAGKGTNYIINYGSYSGDKGSVSLFDTENDTVANYQFKAANSVSMESNSQYAYQVNDEVYFMGNNLDQVFWVDAKTFEQSANGVSKDLVKPRYCVADGNFLYISCWGGDIWVDESLSYIAKFNLSTKKVESTISLPGGPEGLAIVHGKLYAALNYKDSVAVINLNDDKISYIVTPAVSSFFIKDKNENLYVSLISTYSDFSTETGIGYINTNDNTIELYKKDGIAGAYANILSFNNDQTKLYVMASSYDANWNLKGSIEVFDVATMMFEGIPFISDVSSINGLAVDSSTDNVVCFISESTTAGGLMRTYNPDGTFVKEYKTGISPFMMLNVR